MLGAARVGPGHLQAHQVGVHLLGDAGVGAVRAVSLDVRGEQDPGVEPLGDREILCISQFTLYGDTRKGNRPSWIEAAGGEEAEPLYDLVCEKLEAKKGIFGADMKVDLVNDGPVTLLIEA